MLEFSALVLKYFELIARKIKYVLNKLEFGFNLIQSDAMRYLLSHSAGIKQALATGSPILDKRISQG